MRRFKISLGNAWQGLVYAFKNEANFRVELWASIGVLIVAVVLQIKIWELIVVMFVITWVLIMELVNTIIERVVDILRPRIHPYARLIKDMMAAVVLISAIMSLVIGTIIFTPYLIELLS